MRAYYPGDAYVDWIALDGYNWASSKDQPWYSFEEIFGSSYEEILAVAPTKPLMIAEYASDERTVYASDQQGGDKAQWIRDVRAIVPAKFPKIKVLIWFNHDQEGAHWKIDSSASALQAYQNLVTDSYFEGTELN
jgi:beta-mannanase